MYTKEDIEIVKKALIPMIQVQTISEESVSSLIKTLESQVGQKERLGFLDDYPDMMTVKEVAKEIRRSEKTVNRMIEANKLAAASKKKGNLIAKQSVIDWLLED